MEKLIEQKQLELKLVKKLGAQTNSMVELLNKLVKELDAVNSDVEKVDKIMANWGIIVRCISASSVNLLQYQEHDYEKGIWEDSSSSSDDDKLEKHKGLEKKQNGLLSPDLPLPETMIRLPLEKGDDEEKNVAN